MEISATTRVHSQTSVATEIDGYIIATEAPIEFGGTGQFPPATRMVIAALLNCSFAGVKQYCERRDYSTNNLAMHFSGNVEEGIYGDMSLVLDVPAEFTETDWDVVNQIFESCAVKRTIQNMANVRLMPCRKQKNQ